MKWTDGHVRSLILLNTPETAPRWAVRYRTAWDCRLQELLFGQTQGQGALTAGIPELTSSAELIVTAACPRETMDVHVFTPSREDRLGSTHRPEMRATPARRTQLSAGSRALGTVLTVYIPASERALGAQWRHAPQLAHPLAQHRAVRREGRGRVRDGLPHRTARKGP